MVKVRAIYLAKGPPSNHRYSVGLATSFLSGSKEEWSLVRRHPSERMFGVQVSSLLSLSLSIRALALGLYMMRSSLHTVSVSHHELQH